MKKQTGIERCKNLSAKIKKLSALDKYCILCLTCMICYAIIAIIYQFNYHEELSPTLTTCIYSGNGVELFLLAMIKRLKLKKED